MLSFIINQALSQNEHYQIVVIISADGEWKAIPNIFPDTIYNDSPYGQWFIKKINENNVVFFHGGWGKIASAASTQYAINTWNPDLIINLGTCGGFDGKIQKDSIVLVDKAIVYDIYEQMTDNETAIKNYTTEINLTWLGKVYPIEVHKGTIVSGDRDLIPKELPKLYEKYGAVVGDWESGSISWVCARNNVRLLILRGVSDLVGTEGGEAYEGNKELWYEAAERILKRLIKSLPGWLERLDNKH